MIFVSTVPDGDTSCTLNSFRPQEREYETLIRLHGPLYLILFLTHKSKLQIIYPTFLSGSHPWTEDVSRMASGDVSSSSG